MKDKKALWSYITCLAAACMMFVICAAAWELFTETEVAEVVRILADCFTIPGVLFVGITLIGWIGSKGTFDIFGYSLRGLFGLWKKESYYHKQESFYDYRARKDESRKPLNLPMLVVGLGFLLLGGIMTVVFAMMD